jgi:hypothetical protein
MRKLLRVSLLLAASILASSGAASACEDDGDVCDEASDPRVYTYSLAPNAEGLFTDKYFYGLVVPGRQGR